MNLPDGSILVLQKEVKTSVRAEKKASSFPEYLEFRAAYPRKDGTASDRFIAKYRKLTDDGQHGAIIASLSKHVAFWEKSNLAAGRPKENVQFVPHAETWLNQRRWFDEPNDVFVPETKQKASRLEELTAHLDEKTRKVVQYRATQYLEMHTGKVLDEVLISKLVQKYG